MAVRIARAINNLAVEKERFFSFNTYLKQKYCERVQRLSLNAGFSCPNIEHSLGKTGCIYCDNDGFSFYANTNKPLGDQISEQINFYKKRLRVNKFIAYFQSFTNTYADPDILKERYDVIKKFPEIVGLSISTRPDCIDEEKIKLIARYRQNYLVWLEYGLQTTNNRILNFINRGHTFQDFLTALSLTRKYKINTGVHVILGLPLASYDDIMLDACKIANLDIQGIKFHLLHVLKDTALEQMYNEGNINLLDQDQYIKIICDFLEKIPETCVVLRLISSAAREHLIAPQWMKNKHQVIQEVDAEFKKRGTHQGFYNENTCCKSN